MTDYAHRTDPSVFKPLIDAALLEIARKGGGDVEAVQKELDALDATQYRRQWSYLMRALSRTRTHLLTDKVLQAPNHWFDHFLEGNHYDTRDKDVDSIIEYYPERAQEALRQENLVGGYDADIIGLWKRDDGHESVYHAHMEGFWILGEDTIDFVASFATHLKED